MVNLKYVHVHSLLGIILYSSAKKLINLRGGVNKSVPFVGGFKETKMFLLHPRVKVSIVGSLRDREVACSASDHQGSNFESCVWRTVSSQSSHHPQEVLLAQFSLYVHKSGLKPDSFHFICRQKCLHVNMSLSLLIHKQRLSTGDNQSSRVRRGADHADSRSRVAVRLRRFPLGSRERYIKQLPRF